MDSYKNLKANAAIQKVLGELLQSGVKDPRVGFVTITQVDLNRDRSVARVFYSSLGDESEREQCAAGLQKARGFLQRRVGELLKLRQTPTLRFVFDESLDRSFGVESVLHELAARGEFTAEHERRRRLTLADLVPPPDLLAALRGGSRFWIVPHWNPDPDAMGGALALGAALAARDAEVEVLAHPEPPLSFTALPGFDTALPAAEAAARLAESPPDTLILVDCHRRDRAGDLAELLERIPNGWAIDHHLVTGRRLPLPGWIEPAACASCTLIYRVIEELARGGDDGRPGFAVDRDMLTNIYAGLVNDTGGFRFPNTLPLTFELAHRLAAAGVDVAGVSERTLHRRSRSAMTLLHRALETFDYAAEGRILVFRVDRAMLADSGATLADAEGLLNLATAVAGVEFVVFLKELPSAEWRVSLRAPGGGDVQEVAARYGGGGHAQAAGCTIAGSPVEVAERVVDALKERLGPAAGTQSGARR